MTHPVTFIIPAFNAAPTLPQTLASLQAQTVTDWRALVINDGSTDATPAVAESFADPRVEVISQANRGLAGARNTGIRHACTPLVSFLDADDTIDPRYTELMTAALGDHDIVPCAYELVDAHNQPLDWVIRPAPHDCSMQRLIETNAFAVTVVARLDALRRLGTVPDTNDVFDARLRVLEDWDLWLRATSRGLRWATPIDRPLLRYRLVHGLSRNIEHMWQTGVDVITRAPAPETAKLVSLRKWALRNSARAIANHDEPLATRLINNCEPLTDQDLSVLAETLPTAFQRAEVISPRQARLRAPAWRSLIAAAIGPRPWREPLLTRVDRVNSDWAQVATALAAALSPDDIPTLYGMGWNGQALMTELAQRLPGRTIAWIDDHASSGAHPHRTSINDLTPRHAIIVTPNDPAPILAKLAATGARVIWPNPAVSSGRRTA